ncbi:hypothetical+protein [Methylocapsa aurea]|uniref:hypothetical protein n=1 Tax=Methylocapsa aurea TaxID=663610 RepID=UPI003D18B438
MAYLISERGERFDRSFLAASEQKLANVIIETLPDSVTTLRLTKVGVIGAVVAGAALVGCRWSPAWLPVFVAGIFLNWLGMALDGPLARRRNETNQRLDVIGQTNDLLSQVFLILMFGVSPFLSLQSSLVILACYLLFSAYNYVRTIALYARPMSYIGLGSTEFRILMAAWPFVAHAGGIDAATNDAAARLDTAILILAAIGVAGLAVKALSDGPAARRGGITYEKPRGSWWLKSGDEAFGSGNPDGTFGPVSKKSAAASRQGHKLAKRSLAGPRRLRVSIASRSVPRRPEKSRKSGPPGRPDKWPVMAPSGHSRGSRDPLVTCAERHAN